MADDQHYEMLWDCTTCGTSKLLGTSHRYCPNCGKPQDPKARYFPAEGEEIAVENHEYAGADKGCPYCQAPCAVVVKCCPTCGGNLQDADAVSQRSTQSAADGESFAADSARAAKTDFRDQRQQRKAAAQGGGGPTSPGGSGRGKKILIGVALVLGLVLALVAVNTFWTKTLTVEATEHSWQRFISIESMQKVGKSDWCDSMPRDAYSIHRSDKVRKHKEVADGETCTTQRKDMGDGSFRKQKVCKPKYKKVPVYGKHCQYKVDRWQHQRDLKAEGHSVSEEPRWPKVPSLKSGRGMGSERVGKKSEIYKVKFIVKSKDPQTLECQYPRQIWSFIGAGQSFTVQKGMVFGNISCDSLKLEKVAKSG